MGREAISDVSESQTARKAVLYSTPMCLHPIHEKQARVRTSRISLPLPA
jgi:hypothetical protein